MNQKTLLQTVTMKTKTLLALTLAVLAWSTTSHAGITNVLYTSDYSNFLCSLLGPVTYSPDGHEATMTMDSYQYAGNGRMGGTIFADSLADPKLTIGGTIDNDTGTAWSGYEIIVYMDRAFTLSNITPPSGWGSAVIAPTSNPSPQFYGASEYWGKITYTGGTPIPAGGEFDFSYAMNFTGSLQYKFEANMNPIFVPEPSVAALAVLGGLAMAGHRMRRVRS